MRPSTMSTNCASLRKRCKWSAQSTCESQLYKFKRRLLQVVQGGWAWRPSRLMLTKLRFLHQLSSNTQKLSLHLKPRKIAIWHLSYALDGAHLLGVVLASEGGLAGGDLCSDPGDVQLQVVAHLVLLAVVGLARVEEDHTLKMKI